MVFRKAVLSLIAAILVSHLPAPAASACLRDEAGIADDGLPPAGFAAAAHDTLAAGEDSRADAVACLKELCWAPGPFQVTLEAPVDDRGDLLVRFPSPLVAAHEQQQPVALEWYVARDASGQPVRARAILVVHESGSGMTVGRLLARGFHAQGLHAFLIHLPGYGARRAERSQRPDAVLQQMKQGIADVRRARDAISVLPLVDSDTMGLQGTSLGGFVAATVAGLDQGYQRTFILLAGGDLHRVIMSGKRDAAKVRERLMSAGLDSDAVLKLTRPVEPLRLAHRIHPTAVWLYSGQYDDVVPPECSTAFAEACSLPPEHHLQFPADHYSGIVFLPGIILDITTRMKAP